tara:strand:- start:500 stop:1240 length:741 start_codon:yes stop_codon:yes gene_type:complete
MTTWSRLIYQHDPLAIAQGDVNYYSSVQKFGANFDIGSNSDPESVWSVGGLYPWSALDTAETLYIISTDNADTDTVLLEGLDENYLPIAESIQMSGTTAVTTVKQFKRIYRIEYNHGTINSGVVTARTTSATGTIVAQVDAELAQTLMAVYTVPAGFTAYLLNLDFSTNKGKDAQCRLYAREFGRSFRIKHLTEVYENNYRYDFTIPLHFPEKTDIDMIAYQVESAGTRVSCNFDLILVDNARPNH